MLRALTGREGSRGNLIFVALEDEVAWEKNADLIWGTPAVGAFPPVRVDIEQRVNIK